MTNKVDDILNDYKEGSIKQFGSTLVIVKKGKCSKGCAFRKDYGDRSYCNLSLCLLTEGYHFEELEGGI